MSEFTGNLLTSLGVFPTFRGVLTKPILQQKEAVGEIPVPMGNPAPNP